MVPLVTRGSDVRKCLRGYEIEPNDQPPQAFKWPPLCPGREVTGSLPPAGGEVGRSDGDPDDFYRLVVATGGAVTVELAGIDRGPDGARYALFLLVYKDDWVTLGEARPPSTAARARVSAHVDPGDYYVRVWPVPERPRSTMRYTLRWLIAADD
jgi:hypothetical protein